MICNTTTTTTTTTSSYPHYTIIHGHTCVVPVKQLRPITSHVGLQEYIMNVVDQFTCESAGYCWVDW
jgi:hypothetical protein